MKKLLGYDGLSTDETGAAYYVNDDGSMTKILWGSEMAITPAGAITELNSALYLANRWIGLDPSAEKRTESIKRTIEAVKAIERANALPVDQPRTSRFFK